MTKLTPDAREFFQNLIKQPDVQARSGVVKALEDMLSGRKPKPRIKGKPDPSALPKAELIALVGCEGGGVSVYGRRYPKGWRFFCEVNESYFDEEEHHAISQETDNIMELLPKNWPHLCPIEIHPEFLDWFRFEYDMARKNDPMLWDSFTRDHWERLFYGC